MSHTVKIVTVAVLVVLAGLFCFLYFNRQTLKDFEIDALGRPIGTILPKEEGRVVIDHGVAVPPGLPVGMPVSKNPVRVVKSYTETVPGDISEREERHIQTTYAYVTQESTRAVVAAFEKYFKDLTFTVTTGTAGNVSTVHAEKGNDALATVSVAVQNSFEQLVTISVISVERLQPKQ